VRGRAGASLVDLTLTPEHRRGHGALYDGLNNGPIDVDRLRRTLAGLPLAPTGDGRALLAVDVTNWLRPDAVTSPDRLFCHTHQPIRHRPHLQLGPAAPQLIRRTSWIDHHEDLPVIEGTLIRLQVDPGPANDPDP
jgi:hypothetical protein